MRTKSGKVFDDRVEYMTYELWKQHCNIKNKPYHSDDIPQSKNEILLESSSILDFCEISNDPAYDYYKATGDKDSWDKAGNVVFNCTAYADEDHEVEIENFSLFEEDAEVVKALAIKSMIGLALMLRDGDIKYNDDTKKVLTHKYLNTKNFKYLDAIRDYISDPLEVLELDDR